LTEASGPLAGVKIIELAGIGPGPFCAMLLADLGATVLRIERPGAEQDLLPEHDVTLRNRCRLRMDFKAARDRALLLDLIAGADALIEGFRPGVTERLGLGPEDCLRRNPQLVYTRITGWGQEGPLAQSAGHDLNYIALAGALYHLGRAGQPPTPPINLLGDYAGGSLFACFGLLAAVLRARSDGLGQVVDASMVDGAAALMAKQFGLYAAGRVSAQRGTNMLDTGAYFYDTYICADGQYLAVAPIEAEFHTLLFDKLGVAVDERPLQHDRSGWADARARLAGVFLTKPRQHWCALFEGSDACVTPVLSITEARAHPHILERETVIEIDGVEQPAPAPHFSRTPADRPAAAVSPGEGVAGALEAWGCTGSIAQAICELDAAYS